MKAKITKEVIKINGERENKESLYNFPSFKEGQKRLQNIASLCRYKIEKQTKNFLQVNRYGSIFIFRVEKQ